MLKFDQTINSVAHPLGFSFYTYAILAEALQIKRIFFNTLWYTRTAHYTFTCVTICVSNLSIFGVSLVIFSQPFGYIFLVNSLLLETLPGIHERLQSSFYAAALRYSWSLGQRRVRCRCQITTTTI